MQRITLAAIVFLAPYPLLAENVIAASPESVLEWFQDEGFPSKLEEDNVGDPLVSVRYFDADFSVYFYGCQQNTDCTSLQFYSGYRLDGEIGFEKINEWNRERLFSRAYITEEGSARIEYDVVTGQSGVTDEDFDEIVSIWTKAQSDFEDFIDW